MLLALYDKANFKTAKPQDKSKVPTKNNTTNFCWCFPKHLPALNGKPWKGHIAWKLKINRTQRIIDTWNMLFPNEVSMYRPFSVFSSTPHRGPFPPPLLTKNNCAAGAVKICSASMLFRGEVCCESISILFPVCCCSRCCCFSFEPSSSWVASRITNNEPMSRPRFVKASFAGLCPRKLVLMVEKFEWEKPQVKSCSQKTSSLHTCLQPYLGKTSGVVRNSTRLQKVFMPTFISTKCHHTTDEVSRLWATRQGKLCWRKTRNESQIWFLLESLA